MRDVPRDMNSLLEKWNGGKAKLWYYSVSFQELAIRLEKKGIKGNLHIICAPCISIAARPFWDNCNLKITKIKDGEFSGAIFRVEDVTANIVIECRGVHFRENVEPIF